MFKKLLLVVVGAALLFLPTDADAQLFKRRAERRASRTVQAPVSQSTCVYNSQGICTLHGAAGTGVATVPTAAAATGDPEMDAYMARLNGVPYQAAVPTPAAPAVQIAVVEESAAALTPQTTLDTANAKVRILNARLAAAEKAAADALVEAEIAKAQQVQALRNTIAEVTQDREASILEFDKRIAKMTEHLAVLETY